MSQPLASRQQRIVQSLLAYKQKHTSDTYVNIIFGFARNTRLKHKLRAT